MDEQTAAPEIEVEAKTYISIRIQGQQQVFEPEVARDLYTRLGKALDMYDNLEAN